MGASPPHRAIALAALLFASAAAGCGPEPVALLQRPIINGDSCYASDSPSAVGVIFEGVVKSKTSTRTVRALSCTGVLIAPDTVLTAAHCINVSRELKGVVTFEKEAYHISFERDLRTLSTPDMNQMLTGAPAKLPHDAREAGAWKLHPTFEINASWTKGLTQFDDIGLIFLRNDVTSVTPAALITAAEASQVKKGAKVRIAGWGQTVASGKSKDGTPAEQTGGQKVCAEAVINRVAKYEMQIGSDSDSSRKCYGDSGGPSFLDVTGSTSPTERLVGITSHAYDETLGCEVGGVDTRVDAYLGWIDKTLKQACADGDRGWCVVEGVPPPGHDFGTGGGCSVGERAVPSLPWLLALVPLAWRRRRR